MTRNSTRGRSGSPSGRAAAAAAVRREQQRRERRRQMLVVGASALVLLVIVGIGVWVQSTRDTSGKTSGQASFPTSAVALGDTQVAAAETYGLGVGNPKAKVKVEIFEDFLCPFCDQYEKASRTSLRQAAVDGDAYVVYLPGAYLTNTTGYSGRALNAFYVVLDTAGPAAALKFHDLLYDDQPAETATPPSNAWLIQKAVQAGATAAQVTAGIDGLTFRQNVTNATDAGSKRGVNATPTIFANGKQVTGSTIEAEVTSTLNTIKEGQ